jgi:hypothetical protein
MNSTDTSSPVEGTGIDQAAAAFERMLAPEEARDPAQENPELEEAEADEAEALEAEASDETVDEDAEGVEDDADDDADADAEEGEQLELPLDAIVTVKVNGKDEQVQLKEALAGYQRQADYSRKTMELAEIRKATAAEYQQVMQERQVYSQLLTALDQQLRESAPKAPDWENLKLTDPLEYAIQREEWRERQERHSAVVAEQQRLLQLRAYQEQEVLRSQVGEEANILAEKLPVAKDPKQWEKARKELREYGKTIGYSDEELSMAYDHRAVVALYKAYKYDQLMAKKDRVVANMPNRSAPKQIPAGSSNTPPRRVTEITRAKQRLAKTGSVKDAAAIFEKLL